MTAKNGTLKNDLRAIARTIGQTFTSPILSGPYRLATAETTGFPEADRTIYEAAPHSGEILTAKILQNPIDAGELTIDGAPLVARQFQELIKADFLHVAVFGIRTDFTQVVIDQSSENTVQTFLRAYRVR
ncbi:MAG: TetR/AcrR family transcriptional regulator C-terminal domain-containing protein [Oceanococcus sp.]